MSKEFSQKLQILSEKDNERYTRYLKLIEKSQSKFMRSPNFICRAPGRVNLIGEHIDYCGYSVLPMAVSQCISAAVSTNNKNTIVLSNTEQSFSDFTSGLDNYTIDASNPQWFNYALCGLKGVTEYKGIEHPVGMELLIDGTVPKAAGMSSSSALVCVAGLATAYANNCQISKHELADVCAKCERYIGTQGGGMDQSISFLAEKGTAKLISFNPLRAEDVKLPDGGAFVITNSCVKAQKAATSHFNVRVVECRAGVQILAKQAGADRSQVKKFLDLQSALGESFDQMLARVDTGLHMEPYSRKEICDILEISDEEFKDTLLSKNTQDLQTFKLHQRAKHVFSEANRVHQFKAVCDEGSGKDALARLGELMNQSHFSCSDLYECSCQELDELTKLCRNSGALGSRLTGAGWGGCAVSLVPNEILEEFLKKVKLGYYSKMEEAVVRDAVFATFPGDGAAAYDL